MGGDTCRQMARANQKEPYNVMLSTRKEKEGVL